MILLDVFALLMAENARLHQLAHTDPLTGVPNRRALDQHLSEVLHQDVCILMLDLDYLKAINDTGGHSAGDDAIRLVAQALRGALRESDFFARVGGDEFMAVLLSTGDGARVVAERMRSAVEALGYSVSVGLWVREGGEAVTGEEATRRADAALYQAKVAGRNCVREWSA